MFGEDSLGVVKKKKKMETGYITSKTLWPSTLRLSAYVGTPTDAVYFCFSVHPRAPPPHAIMTKSSLAPVRKLCQQSL